MLSVYQEFGECKLKLENGHVLIGDTQVKRLRSDSQEEIKSDGDNC